MKTFKCPTCGGISYFNDDAVGEPHCQACDREDQGWTAQLQRRVKGVEFYAPNDLRNPAKGWWVCLGPTSEMTTSDVSIEHAALLFLAAVCKEHAALNALGRKPSARPPAE